MKYKQQVHFCINLCSINFIILFVLMSCNDEQSNNEEKINQKDSTAYVKDVLQKVDAKYGPNFYNDFSYTAEDEGIYVDTMYDDKILLGEFFYVLDSTKLIHVGILIDCNTSENFNDPHLFVRSKQGTGLKINIQEFLNEKIFLYQIDTMRIDVFKANIEIFLKGSPDLLKNILHPLDSILEFRKENNLN